MVGLVPTIHPSPGFGARGTMDPRDKPEDDTGIFCQSQNTSRCDKAQRALARAGLGPTDPKRAAR